MSEPDPHPGDRPARVLVEVADAVATIALTGPGSRPLFDDDMEAELVDAFDFCDTLSDVRAIVLTSTGDAFCAGLDLGGGGATLADWRGAATAPAGTTYRVPGEALPVRRDGGGRIALRIFDSAVPVIAAVTGPAMGVGATMLLPCDVRLASTTARFGFVFGRRGLPLESCSSWFLPRLVGLPTALEWMLAGRTVDAQEALSAGLVNGVHAPGELLPAAHRLAREIADGCSPTAVSVTRRLLWVMQGAAHPMAAHQAETRALNLLGVGADAREGIAAFVDHRPPAFADRDANLVDDALRSVATSDPPFNPPFPTIPTATEETR